MGEIARQTVDQPHRGSSIGCLGNFQNSKSVSRLYQAVPVNHFLLVISPSPSAPTLQIDIINNRENNQRDHEPLPFSKSWGALKLSVEFCLMQLRVGMVRVLRYS